MDIYHNYLRARRELLEYLGFPQELDTGDFAIVDCTMFFWEIDKGRINEENVYLVYYRTLAQAQGRDEDAEFHQFLGKRRARRYMEMILQGKDFSGIWGRDNTGEYLQIFDHSNNLVHFGITSNLIKIE